MKTKLAKVINLSVFHFRADCLLQDCLDLVIVIARLHIDLLDV